MQNQFKYLFSGNWWSRWGRSWKTKQVAVSWPTWFQQQGATPTRRLERQRGDGGPPAQGPGDKLEAGITVGFSPRSWWGGVLEADAQERAWGKEEGGGTHSFFLSSLLTASCPRGPARQTRKCSTLFFPLEARGQGGEEGRAGLGSANLMNALRKSVTYDLYSPFIYLTQRKVGVSLHVAALYRTCQFKRLPNPSGCVFE